MRNYLITSAINFPQYLKVYKFLHAFCLKSRILPKFEQRQIMKKNIPTTFRNLQVLEEARVAARDSLKGSYFATVEPFRNIIEKVAAANNENHFEAMKRIQDKTDLADAPEKKIIFAAALMEIVEEKNLQF